MNDKYHLTKVEDYEKFVGKATIERIREKAKKLRGLHVVNVNSTYYGGGVAEILDSLTLLLNNAGIRTGWRAIQGAPDFFGITKKMHNAAQGGKINLTEMKKNIYENIIYKNTVRNHLSHHDIVVVHDPQPLPFVEHYRKRGPWIWHCHVDLSRPDPSLWKYLNTFVEKYDAMIVSTPEYKQKVKIPQLIFMPAIDPFSIKNRDFKDREIDERFSHHKIPTDRPIVAQISRFDKWKDPEGVIRAFKIARKKVDATLVLLGNMATDDSEGQSFYDSLKKQSEERILIISREDSALVNALQRGAAVILQKSIREGFGLTVTEAMWKSAAVIGGKVGGICYQIKNGQNGFLVESEEEAAEKIVQLLKDKKRRKRMGIAARKSVQKNFLLIRLLEQYLDLFNSFDSNFKIRKGAKFTENIR